MENAETGKSLAGHAEMKQTGSRQCDGERNKSEQRLTQSLADEAERCRSCSSDGAWNSVDSVEAGMT